MKKLILVLALLLTVNACFALNVKNGGSSYFVVNGDRFDTLDVNDVGYSNESNKVTIYLSDGAKMSYPATYNDFTNLRSQISQIRKTYFEQRRIQMSNTPEAIRARTTPSAGDIARAKATAEINASWAGTRESAKIDSTNSDYGSSTSNGSKGLDTLNKVNSGLNVLRSLTGY